MHHTNAESILRQIAHPASARCSPAVLDTGRVRRVGIRDETQMPLSVPAGFVDSAYRQPFVANAAHIPAPGFVRNPERAITSGLCAAIASTIRAVRLPPPCWMFQERSFIRG
jgi:hypothetical protein